MTGKEGWRLLKKECWILPGLVETFAAELLLRNVQLLIPSAQEKGFNVHILCATQPYYDAYCETLCVTCWHCVLGCFRKDKSELVGKISCIPPGLSCCSQGTRNQQFFLLILELQEWHRSSPTRVQVAAKVNPSHSHGPDPVPVDGAVEYHWAIGQDVALGWPMSAPLHT